MSKLPKVKVEKNPVAEIETTPVKVEESIDLAPVASEWPEVTATGKFVAVPFKEGYVVYNPIAQRVTGVVSRDEASDIVRAQNRAAQL